MNPQHDAHSALKTAAIFVNRSNRARLDVLGPDRATFLHNLTTQEVKRLPVGEGREAFVTSPQGKTLGYVTLLACDDRILLRTDREGLPPILPHLQKYGVFDDVTLDDVSATTFEYHIAGPAAGEILTRSGLALPADGDLRHAVSNVAGWDVRVVRESPFGAPGFTLIGDQNGGQGLKVPASVSAVGEPLGLVIADEGMVEPLRIEAGTPAAGRDVTPDNLPQEVGRDDRAINFVKGCYLGQETVARIDALGHVNKHLRGLLINGSEPPAPGSAVEAGGKDVGVVTSAAYSPARQGVVALAYVRMSHAAPGTAVRVTVVGAGEALEAVVSGLPIRSA
jgi:folate-binding protein YgfZ